MVYKAVETPEKAADNAPSDASPSVRRKDRFECDPRRPGLWRGFAMAVAALRSAAALPHRRRPRASPNPLGGRPAGGARLLGPAAAAGPARSVAPHGDPVSDRNRLSAVQLHRPRRQSRRLQRRSGAAAVRGDQGHLHDPDAAVRDAAGCDRQQPRRRHHRLDGGDAAVARPASISPIPITARRRGSCRGATP